VVAKNVEGFFFNKKLSYFTYCQIWLNFLLGGYHTLTNVLSIGDFFSFFNLKDMISKQIKGCCSKFGPNTPDFDFDFFNHQIYTMGFKR
jgi:hypothetical protein